MKFYQKKMGRIRARTKLKERQKRIAKAKFELRMAAKKHSAKPAKVS